MSKQYNKKEKRKRRDAYLKRKKTGRKPTVKAVAAAAPAQEKTPAEPAA